MGQGLSHCSQSPYLSRSNALFDGFTVYAVNQGNLNNNVFMNYWFNNDHRSLHR